MTIEESQLPLFLGISHRAARRGHGWDLLGITTLLVFPFFPQRLTGLQCIVGIDRELLGKAKSLSYRFLFTDESQPTNQGWSDQNLSLQSSNEIQTVLPVERGGFALPAMSSDSGTAVLGWGFLGHKDGDSGIEILPVPAPPLTLWRPCRVLVDVEINGNRYRRGEIVCGFAPPSPLTEAERRAIASRPDATKSVVFKIGCKTCSDEVAYFSQLNPSDDRPAKAPGNATRLADAPQRWKCRCGEQSIDLTYLKQGFHDLFRQQKPKHSDDSVMRFMPLYEAGRIQDILAEYERLIESSTDEETVQKYLEENPVFWAYLSPIQILHKPAVLTKKRADFGILTAQKVLFLVEIEKPITRLTNQDGSISSEIQKGANQIRDWQMVVGDHRLALLSELGLSGYEVHEIRYLLIGGLARRTTAEGLAKLRRTPFAPNTDFFCFDELGSFIHILARELHRL